VVPTSTKCDGGFEQEEGDAKQDSNRKAAGALKKDTGSDSSDAALPRILTGFMLQFSLSILQERTRNTRDIHVRYFTHLKVTEAEVG
jgi:hypothetical protein